MSIFDDDKYIEETKGVLVDFIKKEVPECDPIVAFPDIDSKGFSLKKPVVYIEFERDYNVERRSGKWTGGNLYRKRIVVVYSFQVITAGDNQAIMERDRIIQKIRIQLHKNLRVFAGKGMRKTDIKFLGAYRLRERIHLARMEMYMEVTLDTTF